MTQAVTVVPRVTYQLEMRGSSSAADAYAGRVPRLPSSLIEAMPAVSSLLLMRAARPQPAFLEFLCTACSVSASQHVLLADLLLLKASGGEESSSSSSETSLLQHDLVELQVAYLDGSPVGFILLDFRQSPSSAELVAFGACVHVWHQQE